MDTKKDGMSGWLFWGTCLSLPFVTFDIFSAYFYPLVAQDGGYNELTFGLFLVDCIILLTVMCLIGKKPIYKMIVPVFAMSLTTLLVGMLTELLFARCIIPIRIGEYGIFLDFLFYFVTYVSIYVIFVSGEKNNNIFTIHFIPFY